MGVLERFVLGFVSVVLVALIVGGILFGSVYAVVSIFGKSPITGGIGFLIGFGVLGGILGMLSPEKGEK